MKAYNTWCSQAVSHPSTNQAQCCLTSVIGRKPVHSTWYGRRHLSYSAFIYILTSLCLCTLLLKHSSSRESKNMLLYHVKFARSRYNLCISNKILKIDIVWIFFGPMCFMAKSAGQNLWSVYKVP